MPTTREPAMGCVSAEWSSAPCTAAEGELLIHLGLLDMERDLINWDAALEIEPPPRLSPSSLLVPSNPPSSLIPLSSPEGASVPPSLPQKPALPPAPASTTVVWQPLCSPSAHHLCGASSVALPYCKITMVRVSLDSASSLQGPDSASAS